MTDRPLACVRWTDAHGNSLTTYEAHEVPHAPAIVQTYGIVIRQDDAGITLACEVFEAGSFRGVTFIPAGMVLEVRYFHAVRPKRARRARSTPDAPVVSGGDAV